MLERSTNHDTHRGKVFVVPKDARPPAASRSHAEKTAATAASSAPDQKPESNAGKPFTSSAPDPAPFVAQRLPAHATDNRAHFMKPLLPQQGAQFSNGSHAASSAFTNGLDVSCSDGSDFSQTKYHAIDMKAGITFDDRKSPIIAPNSIDEGMNHSRRPPSIRAIGDVKLTKTLGSGSTGKVKLGINTVTGEKVAVKVIYRNFYDRKSKEPQAAKEKRILREAAILNLINHPHIVQLYDILITEDYFCLFFEFVDGCQMLDYVVTHGKLKEKQSRKFFRQLLSAVDYCHKNSVVHRDLKIENIMVDKNLNIKLIDFGLSNFYNPKDSLKTFCGSLYFAAPELLKGNVYTGPEVDVWSLGIILYVLVCGKVPFDDKSLPVLHQKIKKCELDIPSDLSSECRHLISRMIVANPLERATLNEVIFHAWTRHGEEGVCNGSGIESYLPSRPPLKFYDPAIVDALCLEFNFDHDYAISVMKGCIINWPKYCKSEIVSVYYLMKEKLQRESASQEYRQPKAMETLSHAQLHTQSIGANAHAFVAAPAKIAPSDRQRYAECPQPIDHLSSDACNDMNSEIRGTSTAQFILDESKIKTVYLKGIFSVNMTNVRSPSLLAHEISKILTLNHILHSINDSVFVCRYPGWLHDAPRAEEYSRADAGCNSNGVPVIHVSTGEQHPTRNPHPMNAVEYDEEVKPRRSNSSSKTTRKGNIFLPSGTRSKIPGDLVDFEIHIVKVAFMGLYGVQFHRLEGDFRTYKSLCAHLLTELNL